MGVPLATTARSAAAVASPQSNFSSSQVMIPPAEKTGRLTLVTGAMARELIVEQSRQGRGRFLHR